MKKFAPLLALFAAAMAFVAPANAAAVSVPVAYADLNGDHRIDRVYVRPAPDSDDVKVLVAVVNGYSYAAFVPMDEFAGEQPLRVADVNGDRRQEIVVTEVVGANTLWLSVWGLNGDGWEAVHHPNGTALRMYEGGGISAISRYGCQLVGGHRELVTVDAERQDPWENGVYYGQRVSYTVNNGVATPTSYTSVTGDYTTIDAMVNSRTCA